MRAKIILAVAVAAVSLTACGPDDSGTPGTAAATAGGTIAATAPSGGQSSPTGPAPGDPVAQGRDGCLTGTWQVDVDDLARQTAAKVGRGATGSGSGALTISFGEVMTIKYHNTITIKTSMGQGLTMVMKNSFTGDATSTDWVAKDGRLAGTMPADAVKSKIVTTINGQQAPTTSVPLSGALDMSAGNLGYTCGGSTATFSTPMVTWHLSKA